jgi:hypothetical protein
MTGDEACFDVSLDCGEVLTPLEADQLAQLDGRGQTEVTQDTDWI